MIKILYTTITMKIITKINSVVHVIVITIHFTTTVTQGGVIFPNTTLQPLSSPFLFDTSTPPDPKITTIITTTENLTTSNDHSLDKTDESTKPTKQNKDLPTILKLSVENNEHDQANGVNSTTINVSNKNINSTSGKKFNEVSIQNQINQTNKRDRRNIKSTRNIHHKSTTRKKKRVFTELKIPPYKWTLDPTRQTLNFWGSGENPFNFQIFTMNTEEAVGNHLREKNKPMRDFGDMVGPVVTRYPNGTRVKVKPYKYSYKGNDNVSEEAQFHRKCMQNFEETLLQNVSVSEDRSAVTFPQFTRRMRLRTRARYRNWTYGTCAPGVEWSPYVEVNIPPDDLFYSSQFEGIGNETLEEYYNCEVPKSDYNDSLHRLDSEFDGSGLSDKYAHIINAPTKHFFELFNTDKTFYDSNDPL